MKWVKWPVIVTRVLLLSAAFTWPTLAAEEQQIKTQRDEPIYIESDSLSIDDTKGISTYQGSVSFRQGTASLKSDTLTIYSRNRQEIERIVAKGTPAHFEQKSADVSKNASGEALNIEYVAPKSLVVFDGQASFRQGENQFTGNRIEYDADKKVVRAGKSVAPDGKSGRVKIVIQPRSANVDSGVGSGGERATQP